VFHENLFERIFLTIRRSRVVCMYVCGQAKGTSLCTDNPKLVSIFPYTPVVAYKKEKSPKDFLVRARKLDLVFSFFYLTNLTRVSVHKLIRTSQNK